MCRPHVAELARGFSRSRGAIAPVETPDGIDMLITARNHDLKQQVAREADAEDWIFALVSTQTMEGYGGRGNFGIARMNGGSSSRSLLGLAPSGLAGSGPDPSSWWCRDLARLIALRRDGLETAPGQAGGHALLWTMAWPEGRQLALADIDPWAIEVCRRIRLTEAQGRISARRANSAEARIAAKAFKGVTGDPQQHRGSAQCREHLRPDLLFQHRRVRQRQLARPAPHDRTDAAPQLLSRWRFPGYPTRELDELTPMAGSDVPPRVRA